MYLERADREWILQVARATVHATKAVLKSSGEYGDDRIISDVFDEYGVTPQEKT